MKNLFLFILSIFLFQNMNATHNFGGDITLNQLAYKQYEVNLNTYTIASSIPADRDSLFLCWGDGLCEWIPREESNLLGCNILKNVYKKIHTYANEGTYIVSMTDPNRNSGVLNLNGLFSDNVPFHIQTTHSVSSEWNQTPIFLNIPTERGLYNTMYQHNGAAIDWDGDSLTYSFITPMQGINEDVPNYLFPNEVGATSTNNLSLDAERGTITWDAPQVSGSYTIAILVKEYRGGQLLSETIRDFLVDIETGPIGPPQNLPPSTTIPFDEVTLSVGDDFNFEVIVDDVEGENILVQAFGLPFLILDTAQFSLDPTFSLPIITGNFSWNITDAHVLLEPYYVVFKTQASIEICGKTSYQVLKININDSPTSTFDDEKLDFKIFPNPLIGNRLSIEVPDDFIAQQNNYKIVNSLGQTIQRGKLTTSNQNQFIDLQQLRNGTYFFILQNEKKIGVRKFTKAR